MSPTRSASRRLGPAALVRRGEASAGELAAAALGRAEWITGLGAVAMTGPTVTASAGGPPAGVPTYVKDHTDAHGMLTGNGSAAVR